MSTKRAATAAALCNGVDEAVGLSRVSLKTVSVVVLPPMRGLPEGHILVTAYHDQQNVGVRRYDFRLETELNAKLNSLLATARETGYVAEIIIGARVHYRTTLQQFQREPSMAVEYCRQFEPQMRNNNSSDAVDADLPF